MYVFALDGLGCKDSVQVVRVQLRFAVQGVSPALVRHSLPTVLIHMFQRCAANTCFKFKMSNETVPPNMDVPSMKDAC